MDGMGMAQSFVKKLNGFQVLMFQLMVNWWFGATYITRYIYICDIYIYIYFVFLYTPPKFNSSPLKMDGWKTSLSYWVSVTFQGRTVKLREGNWWFGALCFGILGVPLSNNPFHFRGSYESKPPGPKPTINH